MKSEHKFPGLDFLRALAISLVFIYHYQIFQHPQWMEGFSRFGWCGVDLFFVLSGFLISNQLFAEWQTRNKISLREFYIKRAFRILPPYLFVLTIYIVFPAFHERKSLAPIWKMLTFTQNYGQDIHRYGTFSHAWSLCVEEQFYLLLPLLLILIFSTWLKQKSAWIILTIFLLTLFLRLIIWHFYLVPIRESDDFGMNWYRWIYYPTFTRLDGLTIGVAIAAVYRFQFARLIPFQKYANHILIIGSLLFAGCYSICANQQSAMASIFGFSLIAITFGLFVLSAILQGSILFRFNSFITKALATLSYSLYLSHKGIIHLVQGQLTKFGVPGDSGLTLMICILACLSGAVIMRIAIEKPALILKNRILNLF